MLYTVDKRTTYDAPTANATPLGNPHSTTRNNPSIAAGCPRARRIRAAAHTARSAGSAAAHTAAAIQKGITWGGRAPPLTNRAMSSQMAALGTANSGPGTW